MTRPGASGTGSGVDSVVEKGPRGDRSYWKIRRDGREKTCTRLHAERRREAIRCRCETLGQGGNGAGGQPDETDGRQE